MVAWSHWSSGARASAVIGASVVAATVGWLVWPGAKPAPAPLAAVPKVQTTGAAQAVSVEPAAPPADTAAPPADVAAVQALAEPAPPAPVPPAPDAAAPVIENPAVAKPPVADPALPAPASFAPVFDLVRVQPDGAATVAGRASPGAAVSLRVDGIEVVQAVADAQGNFAALFSLPASAAPRLMSLVALAPDGAEVPGPDTVAVAPTEPAALAAVKPDAAVPIVDAAPAAVAVAEPAAPAALLVTKDGVKVMQPGTEMPAELAVNVSIDTISYAPDGAVQLGGRGAVAAFVRLYLDDAEKATVPVADGGQWAAVLTDVAAGIYTLRADQIGSDGKVTSRFETPFKRETLEALAAVVAPVAAPDIESAAVAGPEPDSAPLAEPDAGTKVAPAPEVAATDVVSAPAAPAPLPAVEPAALPVTQADPDTPALVSVTVQPGFTLWGIAQERFGDGVLYVQVFEANKDKIRDPDLIYPGQIFTIPTAP